MRESNPLGRLSGLQQMILGLTESLPEPDLYRPLHPGLAPLAWYLGRAVYLETYWVREVVQGDQEMTARVRDIFSPDLERDPGAWRRLPPFDHLLNWALELQEENLVRLANPRRLPDHPLLRQGRLELRILQQLAGVYETMVAALALGDDRRGL